MGLLRKLFGRDDDPAAGALADMREALRLYGKGSYADALRIADRMVAGGPPVALSWRFRGECLFALGRHAEAVESFDKAVAIGGKGTEELVLSSAAALANAGRQAEARERLQRALREGRLSPDLRARAEDFVRKLDTAR